MWLRSLYALAEAITHTFRAAPRELAAPMLSFNPHQFAFFFKVTINLCYFRITHFTIPYFLLARLEIDYMAKQVWLFINYQSITDYSHCRVICWIGWQFETDGFSTGMKCVLIPVKSFSVSCSQTRRVWSVRWAEGQQEQCYMWLTAQWWLQESEARRPSFLPAARSLFPLSPVAFIDT